MRWAGKVDPHSQVGPHYFQPIAWHDRLHRRGRCHACYWSRGNHPRQDWATARPLSDYRYIDRLDARDWVAAVHPTPPEAGAP